LRYIPNVRTSPAKSTQKALIGQLNGRNRIDAFEAAKQVWNIDGNAVAKQLIETLRTGRRPFNRSAAAYAMQAVSSTSVINALERTVRNKSENPDVCGQAAETLAHHHRKSTHTLLIKALQDPSKDVRFWCAFALGQMREKKAVPVLQLLLSDHRLVRGFHSVAKEAAAAISEIEEHVRGGRSCWYCTG
jgi:HEAT repeat protein